ncbi:MAG: hypothetical protein HN644_08220 [Rhodospirillales bacterium]|nr:hypothetical protein [Rhodospirillales bacterium]MBT4039634.1 hypothetical protein [Rhodospirillales bacterium]MBT4625271.1 hypothetical protein [Rhodospirillales bacterium]MBT5352544.1 hypothetical protein [Rhodospirillales bacterium]MBT5519524.1 hypothetical protein [Rhodospirillales bacterium]
MAYDKQSELSLHDIDLIEKCLRREVGTVSSRAYNKQHPHFSEAKANLALIQSLLGKLQNQKAWCSGTGDVASVQTA